MIANRFLSILLFNNLVQLCGGFVYLGANLYFPTMIWLVSVLRLLHCLPSFISSPTSVEILYLKLNFCEMIVEGKYSYQLSTNCILVSSKQIKKRNFIRYQQRACKFSSSLCGCGEVDRCSISSREWTKESFLLWSKWTCMKCFFMCEVARNSMFLH
jgi:hypothetical protein